jgi:diguanylate cyclase (GGDEF)-like protein
MIQLVECCQDAQEAYPVISRHLSRVLPAHGGALCMLSASRDLVECAAQWGSLSGAPLDTAFAPKECWALRRGRAHRVDSPLGDMLCPHVELGDELPAAYVCIPLIAHSETLGILHIRYGGANAETAAPYDERSMQAVVEQLSLMLGNLRLRETLSEQSIRDPLTGLFNRRYMEEALHRDLQRAKRSGNSLTVAMVDVDHFKRFNDTFGHAAGDVVLREVAGLMKSKMRGSDIVCRYGGEEFAIISPEMTLEVALQKMDRLRDELKRISLRHQGRPLDTPTISIGLAAFPIHGGDGHASSKPPTPLCIGPNKKGATACCSRQLRPTLHSIEPEIRRRPAPAQSFVVSAKGFTASQRIGITGNIEATLHRGHGWPGRVSTSI